MEPQRQPLPLPFDPVDPPRAVVPRWGLGDVLVGLLAGLAMSSLATALWLTATGDTDLDLNGQAVSQIGLWTGMMAAILLASRRKGHGTLAEDFGFSARWSDVGLGVAVALAVQIAVLPVVGLLLRPLLGEPEVSGPVRDLIDKAHGPAFIGLIATVGIGAPVVEELFFRGLLLRSLQRRVPVVAAVVLASIAFGLAHASTLPAEAVILVMVSLTVFGAVLNVLAVRTGRLGPGIVAHATFNLFTVALLTITG